MDSVLRLRKRVCGDEGTVSSADLEEPIFLCPVNLPDGSSHLICHAAPCLSSPFPASRLLLSRGETPVPPGRWRLTTPPVRVKATKTETHGGTTVSCRRDTLSLYGGISETAFYFPPFFYILCLPDPHPTGQNPGTRAEGPLTPLPVWTEN